MLAILPGVLSCPMTLDYLALLAADIEAFAIALEAGSPAAEIAGCPGWALPDLGTHLGGVHCWARAAILTGDVPRLDPGSDPAPCDLVGIAGWVRDGGARLVTTLRDMDPQQPTWHPFPVEPKVAGLWMRRQAQERQCIAGTRSARSAWRQPSR